MLPSVYACAKYIGDRTRCETIIWFDEQKRVRSFIQPTMQWPRTPRKQVDIRIFGQYTAPTLSLKRKADTTSFDSRVGYLGDNDSEPVSPSIGRTAKRARYGYADAATQTGEEARSTPDPATDTRLMSRPISRRLPRRRLFDDYLPESRRPPTPFDPFSPRASNNTSTRLGLSVPLSKEPPRQPAPSLAPALKNPTTPSRSTRVSFSESLSGHPRQESPQSTKPDRTPTPTTLPSSSLKSSHIGLITPPIQAQPSSPHSLDRSDRKTPTKETHTVQLSPRLTPRDVDSDDESFGWNEDLDRSIFEVVDCVEDSRASPLFV
ncbi:uncharacterized protein BDV17DRAFT_203968 [Aspergillus undulatus]|uniref:uncharacterized protein n=1 Tax=Aspergillus undulatus TaxID=1810928 RepID=UPI003CCE4F23